MFDVAPTELLLVGVVALVVIGPKDLPQLMRMAAQWVRKGRSMVSGLRQNLVDLTGTAELDGLRAEMNALKRANPLSSLEAADKPANPRPPRG